MSNPKRHHYLPKFYLDRFSDSGHLFVYDRETGDLRRQKPVDTAVRNYYYAGETEGGGWEFEVERLLSFFEGLAKPILDKLDRREIISRDEREDLSWFMAFLRTRTPEFDRVVSDLYETFLKTVSQKLFSTPDGVRTLLERHAAILPDSCDVTPEQLVEFAQRGEYSIQTHRNKILNDMLELARVITRVFFHHPWLVAHAPKRTSFVTTDNPVILLPPIGWTPDTGYGVGLATPDAVTLIPLGQSLCLGMRGGVIRPDLIEHVDIDQDEVRQTNLSLAVRAERFVIGRHEQLVQNLVETTHIHEYDGRRKVRLLP